MTLSVAAGVDPPGGICFSAAIGMSGDAGDFGLKDQFPSALWRDPKPLIA
jgi:hypothetical protein